MQSDPADKAFLTGHPRLWVAGLVLLTLAVLGFIALTGDDTTVVKPPSRSAPPEPDSTTRADSAGELLSELAATLNGGSRREALALAAPNRPAATRAIAAVYDNVRELGIEEVSLRYVDENTAPLSPADFNALGKRAWVADVDLGWQIRGFDEAANQMEVSFTFVETRDGVAFGTAGGDYGLPAPLWLLDELAVEQSRRALVMVADEKQLDRYAALANRAVRDVKKVLPAWRGKLVVQVPVSQDQLNRALDADPGTYDSIAAVTSTVDGSGSRLSPTHIVINPRVFGRLGPDGSQIVMSHEAAHVATDAATSAMPIWLLEGFADYVALAHVDLPVEVTASQILADVRKDGPPAALPSSAEFDPANTHLGASYEAAWLACRLLAERYGEPALIDFYNAVDQGASLSDAFSELGTSEGAFTKAWRTYLRKQAG